MESCTLQLNINHTEFRRYHHTNVQAETYLHCYRYIRFSDDKCFEYCHQPIELRREKTGLPGFRPGPTQTSVCSHVG